MGTISSTTRSIEEDHKDIQDMFAAAKMGNWRAVWRILGSPERPLKPYLINLIPENRRWGVIQQAVWWNNQSVIRTLLKFPTCDKYLSAKEGISEKGQSGGNTAEEIAKAFGHLEISKIIEKHINLQPDDEIDTFYTGTSTIDNEGFGLFRLTLAAYKEAFHPSVIDKTKPLFVLVKNIFSHVNTGNNWMIVRDRVAQSLYCVCKEAGVSLSNCRDRLDFYRVIVNVYTDETTQLYTYLNTALRRQKDDGFKPTSKDLALGPYILMFHTLLYCWNKLAREKQTTYRKMKITEGDLKKYQPGKTFTWLSFVSSSVQQQCAQIFPSCEPSGDIEVHFIINNSRASQWRPLNIEEYACYTERERVYPAGAQFLITKRLVESGVPTVYLQLMAAEI